MFGSAVFGCNEEVGVKKLFTLSLCFDLISPSLRRKVTLRAVLAKQSAELSAPGLPSALPAWLGEEPLSF